LVGVVQPEDFTVTNSGQAVVKLMQATLTGTNSAEFKILQNTCNGSINLGASCTMTMKREFHVRFCESLRKKFLGATRPIVV